MSKYQVFARVSLGLLILFIVTYALDDGTGSADGLYELVGLGWIVANVYSVIAFWK